MTRIMGFFSSSVGQILSVAGSWTAVAVDRTLSLEEVMHPYVSFVTMIGACVTTTIIALLYIRKGVRTLIADVKRKKAGAETSSPFKS